MDSLSPANAPRRAEMSAALLNPSNRQCHGIPLRQQKKRDHTFLYVHLRSTECSHLEPYVNFGSQLTQSKSLYKAPANGRNQGLPLYRPRGAPGNGISTKGLSGFSPAISSAIFCPCQVAIATP
jgi:hypothetical protein